MKLELTRGCICDSMTVDGVEEIDLTTEERRRTINKICKWLEENSDSQLNYVLQELIPMMAQDYEYDSEPCECCGDYVEHYTWTI